MRLIDADKIIYSWTTTPDGKEHDGVTLQSIIKQMPTIEQEPHYDEWCNTCKKYDHEKHCCPRFNMVIRQTLKDTQPEIIHCGDCRHADYGKRGVVHCMKNGRLWEMDDYCSYAEREVQ